MLPDTVGMLLRMRFGTVVEYYIEQRPIGNRGPAQDRIGRSHAWEATTAGPVLYRPHRQARPRFRNHRRQMVLLRFNFPPEGLRSGLLDTALPVRVISIAI